MKTFARLGLAVGATLLAAAAIASPVVIDNANPANGITNIFSVTFDGPLPGCPGGSPSYCSFFGGLPLGAALVTTPSPTGVTTGVPGGIVPVPLAGSFLDLTLSGGNTQLTLGGGTIAFPAMTITILGGTANETVLNTTISGMVFSAIPAMAAVNPDGQAEFLVSAPVDFSTLGLVLQPFPNGCNGPLCALLGGLTLDMVRYRLFIDYDPTFTSFTGSFIGQTGNNSMIYATLNSGNPITLVPVPAAVWLMGSAVGLLGWIRRRAAA